MSIQAQLNFALNFGLNVQNIICDTRLHRVPTVDKPLSKNGYYVSFENGIYCGDWATNREKFYSTCNGKLTRIDWRRINHAKEQAQIEKRNRQSKASAIAKKMYAKAWTVKSHPYLTRKGINPTPLMRVASNELFIPLYSLSTMQIENIQRIKGNGTKLFLSGGKVTGLCFVINYPEQPQSLIDDSIYLAEGVATALSIAEQSNCFTVACMNAGNLKPVGIELRKLYPTANIIVAGDNDYLTALETDKNTGVIKAQECAEAINASVSFPPLTQAQLESGLSDWNDYIQSLREVAND